MVPMNGNLSKNFISAPSIWNLEMWAIWEQTHLVATIVALEEVLIAFHVEDYAYKLEKKWRSCRKKLSRKQHLLGC